MSNNETPQSLSVIDESVCQHLDQAIKPMKLSAKRKDAMRMTILDRIDNEEAKQDDLLLTIRQNQGQWIQLAPKIEKKILFVDRIKGIENYLLKMYPGATVAAHEHQHDEICLVLEGSVDFDELHLNAGDHHVARKGSFHGLASSQTGALLYLQSGLTELSLI